MRIPNAWNRTNIRSWVPNKGVPVDILVVPTLADFQAKRDRALDVARRAADPERLAPSATLAAALKGRWTGTLDYRDDSNGGRIVLPTILDTDGTTLSWTYDDGPGKTVRSSETWTFDPTGRSVSIRDGKTVSTRRVSEFRQSADGAITAVLDGNGTANETKVISRTVMTFDKRSLRLTEMTRQAGTPFLMRHSYELSRR